MDHHHHHHPPPSGSVTNGNDSGPMANQASSSNEISQSMLLHLGFRELIIVSEWQTSTLSAFVASCVLFLLASIFYEATKCVRRKLRSYNLKFAGCKLKAIPRNSRNKSVCKTSQVSTISVTYTNNEYRSTEEIGGSTIKLPMTGQSETDHKQNSEESVDSSSSPDVVPKKRGNTGMDSFVRTLCYVIQFCMSYFLMLGVMTYNIWICISIVVGVAIGYYLFNSNSDEDNDDSRRKSECDEDEDICH